MQFCEHKGIRNMQELARRLKYSSAEKLYRLERDKNNNPSYQILLDLSNVFEDLDITWLVNGRGSLPMPVVNEPDTIYETKSSISHKVAVPLFRVMTSTEIALLLTDAAHAEPVGYISVPNLPACDGAVYVTGNTMHPLIKSGDIVLYKQVYDLNEGFIWGEMYIINYEYAREEMAVISYVKKSGKGPDYILLCGNTKNNNDRDIPLSKVRAIALIRAGIWLNTIG